MGVRGGVAARAGLRSGSGRTSLGGQASLGRRVGLGYHPSMPQRTEKNAPSSERYVTFGCKANQYDTQVLREALGRRGLTETNAGADLIVVNTCTVTAEAGRKARQLVRRIAR